MKKPGKNQGKEGKINSQKSKGALNTKTDNLNINLSRQSVAQPSQTQSDSAEGTLISNSQLPLIGPGASKKSIVNFQTNALTNRKANNEELQRVASNKNFNEGNQQANAESANKPFFDEPNLDIPDTKQPENTDNVKVVARFRPLNKVEQDLVERGMGGICVKYHKKDGCAITNSVGFTQNFTLDRIFDSNTTQKLLFEEAACDTIKDILRGYNGTIFTYGQSGSGKTHTMYGASLYDNELKGIIPRTIEYMFEYINHPSNEQIKFQIKFSMLEIYKECLYDLLNPEVDSKDLKIKENKDKSVYVKGLTEEYISNIEEFLLLIDQADQFRVVSETGLNKQSSRSHLLFIIEVLQQLPDGSEKCGKLNLIDLAGSEKIGKTGAVGDTLEEAKKINLSLSTLGQVISSLSSEKDYIPYRDSKLTRVLQDSLGGNFKTTLIVACSPHVFNSEESAATLKFATRAKKIKNKVKQNIKKSTEELERIIEDLTQKLQKAKDHILKLKKKINALPQSLKNEYKEVFDDLQLDAEKDIKEIINEKIQAKDALERTKTTNDLMSNSALKIKIDDIKERKNLSDGEEKANPIPELDEKSKTSRSSTVNHVKKSSFVSNKSKDSSIAKKKIFTLKEFDEDEESSGKENSLTKRNKQTIEAEVKSRDESLSGSLYQRLSKAVPTNLKLLSNKNQKYQEKDKDRDNSDLSSTMFGHKKNQLSSVSEISHHLNLQTFDSPCKIREVTPREKENFSLNIINLDLGKNQDKSENQSERQNFYEALQATNSVKEQYERKLIEREEQIKGLTNEIENLTLNFAKQKDSNLILKDKIKALESKEDITVSRLEHEIEKVVKENKAFIESLSGLKGQLSSQMNNALKDENRELKRRLQKFEKEYFEIFKNLKYLENESFLNNTLKQNVDLFEGEEELFSRMKMDESYYIQYLETFKLSKSFVKDVLNFFITKRDFFNCNIYENLEMIKSSERYKNNNVKSCFIKFSAIAVFYEKLILDLMNKVSLDLRFKAAEAEYYKTFSSVVSKFESLFLNYNNIIEETKRIKLDEVNKMHETMIENQYTTTNHPTGNLITNNRLLLKQSTIGGRNSPKNEYERSNFKTKASFIMASNEHGNQLEEKPVNYGVIQFRKNNYNNIVRKVTKVVTKGGMPGLEGLKKLKQVQSNLDHSHIKNQSSNSIVNIAKANKNSYNGPSGLFKKDGENQQVTNTITETDENDEREKTTDNFFAKKLTSKLKGSSLKENDKDHQKTEEENKKVSFKRDNSASSFDSQHKENNATNGTYTNNTVNTEEAGENVVSTGEKDKNYLKIEINSPSLRENKVPNKSIDVNNNQSGVPNVSNINVNNMTDTNSKLHTTENMAEDSKLPNSLKFFNRKITNNATTAFQNPVRRRVSKIDLFNEQNSSFCPINSFIGGSAVDGNYESEKYISEIKQLKSEIQMYKQYIATINDKLENEVKLKNSYIVNLKDFEKRNKVIYKTEIDNLHVCFEIYKDFYQNELDHRKDVIINLHNTLEEVLANAKFDSEKQSRRNFFSDVPSISNVNINYNINNISHFNAGPNFGKTGTLSDTLQEDKKPLKLNINSPTFTEVLKNIPSRENMNTRSVTFKKGEVNFASLNPNYSENNILNDNCQENNSLFHSKNKSINTTSIADYYKCKSYKMVCDAPATDMKEAFVNLFYEECGSATKKFDFINISLNESNNVEVAYGNGLNSKHKGKSPLTRPFKVSFEGDHCDDVNSNKGD